ncbi:hypothetical protein ANTQUA_LOCUS1282 [Anthophora quadrimaculata]
MIYIQNKWLGFEYVELSFTTFSCCTLCSLFQSFTNKYFTINLIYFKNHRLSNEHSKNEQVEIKPPRNRNGAARFVVSTNRELDRKNLIECSALCRILSQ